MSDAASTRGSRAAQPGGENGKIMMQGGAGPSTYLYISVTPPRRRAVLASAGVGGGGTSRRPPAPGCPSFYPGGLRKPASVARSSPDWWAHEVRANDISLVGESVRRRGRRRRLLGGSSTSSVAVAESCGIGSARASAARRARRHPVAGFTSEPCAKCFLLPTCTWTPPSFLRKSQRQPGCPGTLEAGVAAAALRGAAAGARGRPAGRRAGSRGAAVPHWNPSPALCPLWGRSTVPVPTGVARHKSAPWSRASRRRRWPGRPA